MVRSRNAGTLAILLLAGFGPTLGASQSRAAEPTGADSSAVAGAPVAVSPGSAAGTRIGERCPTFSWGGVAGADRYELIVYIVGEEGEEAQPVLLDAVPGSALSWTPSRDRCLEPGGRYAWSVRALDAEQTSEWSSPSLFRVGAGPGELELERALDVVRRYVEERDRVEAVDAEGATATATAVPAEFAVAAEATRTTAIPTLPVPEPLAPAGTQMSVDGNVDADSFSGSAFLLTGLRPDPPCFSPDRRFLACGNGTVTDGVTGLVYLEDTDCFAAQPYVSANALAALTKDGVCGLTDGSHRGDWRLPTVEEWETILDPGCATTPKLVGNGTPIAGCFSDNGGADAWITVSAPTAAYWSSTTAGNLGSAFYGVAQVASFVSGNVAATITNKPASVRFWMVRGGR